MRSWIKPFALGIFTTVALAGGVAAWSHGELPGAMGWHGDRGADHFARFQSMITDKLALDAAQQARLGLLATRLKTQAQAMHGSTDPHAQMLAFVQQNAFDRSGAQQMLDTKLQAMRDGGPQVIAAIGDFYDGLRPDQQQKLRDFMASHHEHGGMHMEMHGGDHGAR